ncbi:hypothetical protein Adt_21355 [Abeliophyllum distichum]|uniref:Uncharacterized protein n=1 Tax=Abeliophyllum distichum TaxID=126358 RepID=A0ABD1SZ44_9LAMI
MAHNHLKEHVPSCPYGELYAEELQKCIDFFTSLTFVEQLTKNKANRGKAKYLSVQGSKIFSAMHYDQFCEDAQNDDPRFSMYEAQLRRIERTIVLFTANLEQRLPEIVPDDNKEVAEDKNDGGGLGDL